MTNKSESSILPSVDLDELKKRVDLRALVPPTEARSVYTGYVADICPFHYDTAPSLMIYPQKYKCTACHAWGDVWDYLRGIGKTFHEALALVSQNQSEYTFTKKKKRVVSVQQRLGMDLHLNIDKEILDYYEKKLGFTRETVQRFQLGYGTFGNYHKDGEAVQRTVGRFSTPIYNRGKLVNVQLRRDDRCPNCRSTYTQIFKKMRKKGNTSSYVGMVIRCDKCGLLDHPDPEAKSKYLQYGGAEATLFNADELYGWVDGVLGDHPIGNCFLTEGAYKSIALVQNGLYSISYPGSTSFRKDWISDFLPVKWLTIVGDDDNPGHLAAQRIRDLLPMGKIVYLPNPPKGDPVDYFQEHTREEFFKEVEMQRKLPRNTVMMGPYV